MARARENEVENQSPKTPEKDKSKGPPIETTTSNDQAATVKVKSEPKNDADDHLRSLLQKPLPSAAEKPRPPAPTPAQVARPSPSSLQGGQRTIHSYFTSAKAADSSEKDVKKPEDDEPKTPAIDLESIRGIFGWTTLEGVHIPFIMRQEEKFTAVRIIEKSLLKKYLQALPTDVYSCTYIKSYFITDNEAKLLNEINMKHCDRQFGHELFTTKDLVVQLNDVEQLYEFLSTCYYKLTRSSQVHKKESRCGIITIEGGAIPYIRRNGTKYVPLSLFDQEVIKLLEMKAEKLEAWEVSYLKFCCKVAGIGNEFLLENTCLVVSTDDVQQTVGDSVRFEEWWPSAQSERIHNSHSTAAGFWTANNGRSDATPLTVYYDSQDTIPPPTPPQHNTIYNSSSSERGYADTILPVTNASQNYPLPQNVLTESTGTCNNFDKAVHTSQISYPLHTATQAATIRPQPESGVPPPPNPRQFMYNGQWWGSISTANPSAEGRYCPPGFAHCQSLAAHCPEGPTQCSPSATQFSQGPNVNASSVLPNSTRLSHYPQGVNQIAMNPTTPHSSRDGSVCSIDTPQERRPSSYDARTSDYSQLIGYPRVQAPASRPPPVPPPLLRSPTTSVVNGNLHSDGSPLNANGQYYRVLPNAPPPLVKDSASSHPKVSSAHRLQEVARNSPYPNGTRANGIPLTGSHHVATSPSELHNGGASSQLVRISESFLAKHLLNSNGTIERPLPHHLERYGVAPGNVQSIAGKMSSPKPGNPVPISVIGDNSHRLPYNLDGISRTTQGMPQPNRLEGLASPLLDSHLRANMTSKLQQLLHTSQSLPPNAPSQMTAEPWAQKLLNTVPKYKLQQVMLAGNKFRAINATEYQHTRDRMVLLIDLSMNIKAQVPVSTALCKHILVNVLGVRLYRANPGQEEVIKSRIGNFDTTLIRDVDVHKYLPQLIYSVASLHMQHVNKDSQPMAKKARVEHAVSS